MTVIIDGNRDGYASVDGPAFSAYASTPTNTASNVPTKLVFATEEFDTNNNYDTGSSRFTPTVAGYYQINGAVNSGGYYQYTNIIIYKNGTAYKNGVSFYNNAGSMVNVSSLVYLNGSTDYVELYWVQASGATVNSATGIINTYFNGALVRRA